MVRTLISLPKDDKAWLEQRAKAEGVSMAELVRRAIERFRDEAPGEPLSTQDLLARTAGIRSGEDGLALQKRLRREWSEP